MTRVGRMTGRSARMQQRPQGAQRKRRQPFAWKADGKLIPRPSPTLPLTDAEKKAATEKKLREAVMSKNKEGLELRKEDIERNRNRGPNAIDKALREYAWGVDSMASLSVTGNRNLLSNVRKCAPFVVKVADGKMISVMHKGDTKLRLKVLGE